MQPARAKTTGMKGAARDAYLNRNTAMESERSTWIAHWRDVGDYVRPRRWRYLQADRNKGVKRNEKIINGTPLWALRTLQSGMMAGISSPARPWFRLSTPDAELSKFGPVAAWLAEVTDRMRIVFARSNIYNSLHTMYGDLGAFGTATMNVDEDDHTAIRSYVYPLGQYSLAHSARQVIDTCYRRVSMSVAEVVEKFAWDSISKHVQQSYRDGRFDEWVDILHAVEPNRDYDPGKSDRFGKKWLSVWIELGEAGEKGKASGKYDTAGILDEKGYEEFPIIAARWDVTGEDVYGWSPGMDALGDAKGVQLLERRKAQAVGKIVNPPMVGPSSLRMSRASTMEGDIIYVDGVQGSQRFEPAIIVPPAAVQVSEESIGKHEFRLNKYFFTDLWMMLAQEQGQMTAREVAERHEEKMLQLGPTLSRLDDEIFDPLIDRTFAVMVRLGLIPPPPRELQGRQIRAEYISIMAQAQKLIGISSDERLVGFVGNIAGVKPDVMDLIDTDAIVRDYADKVGTSPDVLVPPDVVAKIRAARAKEKQAMQQTQVSMAMTQGAANLSKADMSGDNALSRLANAVGPGAAANLAPPGGSP